MQEGLLEAATGVEPVIKVLQTSALPLGYAAPTLPALRAASRLPAAGSPLPPARRWADGTPLAPVACPYEAILERVKGLEPSTFCMASRRSSQLSYTRADG